MMISYLLMPNHQAVLQNNSSHLTNLIRFRVTSVSLEVDPLFDSGSAEYVMASASAHLEPQRPQQCAQLVESNICIRGAAQDLLKCLIRAHNAIVLSFRKKEP
jgi:hypothetical protein